MEKIDENVLVIGSNGQVGTALVRALRRQYGENNVLAADWLNRLIRRVVLLSPIF